MSWIGKGYVGREGTPEWVVSRQVGMNSEQTMWMEAMWMWVA